MKTKLLFYSALLITILTGSVLSANAQYTNQWIRNFAGVDAGNNLQTQHYNGLVYSVIVDANSDQTYVVCTNTVSVEVWDYDFDDTEPEGRVLRIQTTQHGLVVMGSKSISLLDYETGIKLYNYEFDDEYALDDDGFFSGGNVGFDYSHRNVWETDTSLVFVGVMHDNTTETWTVHVKHANLTGGYHWEYEVLALSESPMMSYGGSNSFTINHLDGNILNIYHMNLTSGSLGQFPELEDLVLPITGDWITLNRAEMDSERQHLLISGDAVYYYSISFDNYSSEIYSYVQDYPENYTVSWLFKDSYIFVCSGNEMLYRTDGVYANLLTDGGSNMMRGSPSMIEFGNILLVIYNDNDDKDTHILYYDQDLNLISSQIFNNYIGISQFMFGVVAGAGDEFYLYGCQQLSDDPDLIIPSLSYWSGGGLVSVSELKTESDISIYPNPVSDYLTIDSQYDVKWEFYTITGQEVTRGDKKQINVHHLSDGLYMLKIKTADGQIFTEKILKH